MPLSYEAAHQALTEAYEKALPIAQRPPWFETSVFPREAFSDDGILSCRYYAQPEEAPEPADRDGMVSLWRDVPEMLTIFAAEIDPRTGEVKVLEVADLSRLDASMIEHPKG